MAFFKKRKTPHVYIGVPVSDGIPPAFVGALYNLMLTSGKKYRYDFSLNAVGSVAISRDQLTRLMLDVPDSTGILFVDDDMKWTPAFAEKIIGHGKDIVGGIYSKRIRNGQWCMNGLKGEEIDQQTGLLRVKEIGTGFLWVSRKVFQVMQQEMPEIEYPYHDPITNQVRPMWNFFFQGVVKQENYDGKVVQRFLGEDYGFCHFARKLGFDIYADTQVIIPHTGKIDYPLNDDPRILALKDAPQSQVTA